VFSPESQFRTLARQIALDIADRGTEDSNGVYWVTATAGGRWGSHRLKAQSHVYAGGSGIGLFLLEAGRLLDLPKVTEVALAALHWAARQAEREPIYSLYCGRVGTALALIRATAVTGNTTLVEDALRLARGYEIFLEANVPEDLLTGTAGAAVGFMQLHAATGEAWTARAAEAFLARLIHQARWVPEGVCWNVRREFMRGLCGFSHGNAGIATALLEGSRYFGQPGYERLALEAFAYENALFDSEQRTWPDYRKMSRLMDEDEFIGWVGDSNEFFRAPGYMDTWCHGAPGIALSRARAVELLGSDWLPDLQRALAKTEEVTPPLADVTLTLCHGVLGNAAAYLEAHRVLGEARYRKLAEDAGLLAVQAAQSGPFFKSGYTTLTESDELSLFMGTPGIGYFLLQLASDDVPSILLPRVCGNTPATKAAAEGDVARVLAENTLPYAMSTIEEGARDAFFANWRSRAETFDFAARHNPPSSATDLEMALLRMRDGCTNFALVRFQQLQAKRRGYDRDSLAATPLQLAPHVEIWADERGDGALRIIEISGGGVIDHPLRALASALLPLFEQPRTLSDATSEVLAAFEAAPEEESAIREAVAEQVLDAVSAGVLVVAVAVEATAT